MNLDRTTRKEIIQLMMPFVNNTSSQNALISSVFFTDPLANEVQAGATPKEFSEKFLKRFVNEQIDGDPVIVILLEEIRERVGTNKQAQIDDILRRLRLSGDANTKSSQTSGTQPNQGTNTSIQIGGSVSGSNINIGGTQHITNDDS